MNPPFLHVHHVRFDEVDAAGIVYFPRALSVCHDAMASMLAALPGGGYVALVTERRLGLPAVHIEADFASPLRFGDEVHVATVVERVGQSSFTLRFDLSRAPIGVRVATVRHVVVLTDLATMTARPISTELRTLLERHREPAT